MCSHPQRCKLHFFIFLRASNIWSQHRLCIGHKNRTHCPLDFPNLLCQTLKRSWMDSSGILLTASILLSSTSSKSRPLDDTLELGARLNESGEGGGCSNNDNFLLGQELSGAWGNFEQLLYPNCHTQIVYDSSPRTFLTHKKKKK